MSSSRLLWESLRPKQWLKNLLLFAGLVFSKTLFEPALLFKAFAGFILFCLLSGATYLLNDISDRFHDSRHPQKCNRPIASGRLSPRVASIWAAVFFFCSLGGAMWLNPSFGGVALVYFLTQILYSLWLKKVVIIDIFAVVFSHFLRILGGTVLIGVQMSSWLLVCGILLALFLVLCKRRHELTCFGEVPVPKRTSGDYSERLLDQMVSMVSSAAIISYCFYCMDEKTIQQTGTEYLKLTIPFVLYGIFRYLYLVYRKSEGGYPEETLLKDEPLIIDIILWIGAVIAILYGLPGAF